jgi:hypothetical protein
MAAKQVIPVDFISRYHRYRGMVENNGSRLSDLLTDPTHDFVEIRDARITTLGHELADLPSPKVILKRQEIVLVIPQGPYEAPAGRITHFIKKSRWRAVIEVCGHMIEGTIHLPPKTPPISLLRDTSPLRKFVAVTDVTMHSALLGSATKFATVLVSRQAIESLEVTVPIDEDAPEKPPSEAPVLETAEGAAALPGAAT